MLFIGMDVDDGESVRHRTMREWRGRAEGRLSATVRVVQPKKRYVWICKACRIQEGCQDTENETCKVFQESWKVNNNIHDTTDWGFRRPRLRLRGISLDL